MKRKDERAWRANMYAYKQKGAKPSTSGRSPLILCAKTSTTKTFSPNLNTYENWHTLPLAVCPKNGVGCSDGSPGRRCSNTDRQLNSPWILRGKWLYLWIIAQNESQCKGLNFKLECIFMESLCAFSDSGSGLIWLHVTRF